MNYGELIKDLLLIGSLVSGQQQLVLALLAYRFGESCFEYLERRLPALKSNSRPVSGTNVTLAKDAILIAAATSGYLQLLAALVAVRAGELAFRSRHSESRLFPPVF